MNNGKTIEGVKESMTALNKVWQEKYFEMAGVIIWFVNFVSLPLILVLLLERYYRFVKNGSKPQRFHSNPELDFKKNTKIYHINECRIDFWASSKYIKISNAINFVLLIAISINFYLFIIYSRYDESKQIALFTLLFGCILQTAYLLPCILNRHKISGMYFIAFLLYSCVIYALTIESATNPKKSKLSHLSKILLYSLTSLTSITLIKLTLFPCRYFVSRNKSLRSKTGILYPDDLNLFSRLTFIYFFPTIIKRWWRGGFIDRSLESSLSGPNNITLLSNKINNNNNLLNVIDNYNNYNNNNDDDDDDDEDIDFPPQARCHEITKKLMNVWKDQGNRYESNNYIHIWKMVWKSESWSILRLLTIRIIGIPTKFIFPLLVQLIQLFYNRENFDEGTWQYYFLFIGFILSFTLEDTYQIQYFHASTTVQKRITASLTKLIYTKILKLSLHSEDDMLYASRTFGFIGNDIPSITTFIVNLPILLSSPLELTLFVYALYYYLNYAIIIGFSTTIIIIGLAMFVVKRSKILLEKQLEEKDRRINALKNLLGGIKIIKLHAWEKHFEKQINEIRQLELQYFKKESIYHNFSTNVWSISSITLTLVSFFSYILIVERNTPLQNLKFTHLVSATYLLVTVKGPISLIPLSLISLIQVMNYSKRLHQFLNLPQKERQNYIKEIPQNSNLAIQTKDSEFIHDNDNRAFKLKLKDLSIEKGSFVGITGRVGSGKTSFFKAILGNMILDEKQNSNNQNLQKCFDSGTKIRIQKSIAYSEQEAWIRTSTLRENILFFKDFDSRRYREVLKVCSLLEDIYSFNEGDQTKIGEKGINLSGGQKQRVSLARAVYADKDLYLLDDSLSAVDVNVGKNIFKNCLSNQGILKDKTRLFITNNPQYLKECDRVLVIEEGQIIDDGHFNYIATRHPFIYAMNEDQLERIRDEPDSLDHHTTTPVATSQPIIPEYGQTHIDLEYANIGSPFYNINEISAEVADVFNIDTHLDPDMDTKTEEVKQPLTQKPFAHDNSLRSLVAYFLLFTKKILVACILSFAISVALLAIAEYAVFLFIRNSSIDPVAKDGSLKHGWLLTAFSVLSVSHMITLAFFFSMITVGSHNTSKVLHKKVLRSILHWKLNEFQKIFSGVIMNAFSKDLFNIDFEIPKVLHIVMLTTVGWFVPFVQIAIIDSSLSIYIFLALIASIFIQRIYVASVKKYGITEAAYRSPLLTNMVETFNGLQTIQAMEGQDNMMAYFETIIDKHTNQWYLAMITHRWGSIALNFVCTLLVIIYLSMVHYGQHKRYQGVKISYVLSNIKKINLVVIWATRLFCDIEVVILSMMRLARLREPKQEPSWDTPRPLRDQKGNIVHHWPSRGEIKIVDLDFKYNNQGPYLLQDINLNIEPGQKVGIVGRSGAGKSSLINAIFRVEDPYSGMILIDNVNTLSLGLHDLRRNLSLIPQDPIIFETTLRSNIDPEGHFANRDAKLIEFLHLVGMEHFEGLIQSTVNDQTILDVTCREDSFSQGQKQLICLLRAMVRNSKILILDEATASVDNATDALVQSIIKTRFQDTTIITVAHRIQTIFDYDKIVVMSKGRVIECGSVQDLIAERGEFYDMCVKSKLLDNTKND